MGVDTRKPLLPAPTDSSAIESNGGSVTPTDLTTDISRRTDKTSHTVPDDGRPITINTGKKRSTSRKLSKSHHRSQTSLLIEYFEAEKGQNITSRPSVRVKVTPSARKAGEKGDGEVVVSEARGSRKPSYRRRISLGADSPKQTADAGSVSSFSSLSEEPRLARRGVPVEVEVLPREGSELSGTSVSKAARFIAPSSDISSMPPDSMLESNSNPTAVRPDRSRSLSREEVVENNTPRTPARRRSRSLSRERLTQKVLEKLANRPREVSTDNRRRHAGKSSSRSGSKGVSEGDAHSHGRLSSRQQENGSVTTGAESSLFTNSALSANRKSGDQISFKSGTSKSSVNNPKLLDAFEDVLRRVIIPELKELKKDKKVASNRSKFERVQNQSDISGSSVSQEEIRPKATKHGNTPETKPRTSSGKHSSGSRKGERRRKEADLDSPSERSHPRRESGDSLSIEENRSHRRKKEDNRLRNAAAGALVGGALTAAALQHHDSGSSVERRERRKQSRSRSRSTSVAETEEIFERHGVPPMPMRSDVETELTRSSLLSEQTATTPTQGELRRVPQGSPRQMASSDSRGVGSPTIRTPTRTPVDRRRGLGTHHGNLSNHDLSSYQKEARSGHDEQPSRLGEGPLAGTPAAARSLATNLLADEERQRRYESNLHHQHPIRRGLSPIQSVASYNTSEPNRNSMMLARSSNSLASLDKEHRIRQGQSTESLSSAPSTSLARPRRPEGINLETGSEILGQHDTRSPDGSRNVDADAFFDEQHSENERYRDSYASGGPKVDYRRLTTLTDDSLDPSYLDKMTAGQQVTRGHGANPEYVHAPAGVESAVASLYDPSLESVRSTHSSARSQADSIEQQKKANLQARTRDLHAKESGSPLKQEYAHDEKPVHHRVTATSPPQSVAFSQDDRDEPKLGASGIPVSTDPMPEIGMGLDSPESEITTNPSVIHGPIGGSSHGNRDHWPYGSTPPRSKSGLISAAGENRGLGLSEAAVAGGALGAGLGALAAGHDAQSKDMPRGLSVQPDPMAGHEYDQNRDTYMTNPSALTPPKDEGYISAANPGTYSPDPKTRAKEGFDVSAGGLVSPAVADDPFLAKHNGHLGATGKGIEDIQSKDIVALMDHLTVRDAQRNARDTEILVTLVRSAAEMRNSFEDMKRFIAEQDDFVMDTADKQHDKTVQKIVSGPRPQPLGTPRFPLRAASEEDEDTPAKRRNVFKRALRGLSTKNTTELQNIESMLMRLLGEVEGLRADQDSRPFNSRAQSNSINSVDNGREPTDPGYEPEGQAGTSSTGDRSGCFSNNSSRQADHRGAAAGHRDSANRVSTVMEGDEDPESLESPERDVVDQRFTNGRALSSPDRATPDAGNGRGGSLPLATTPRDQVVENRALSNENTPHMSTDGKSHRKHKSISSSFHPRMVSRWSKTTASSIVENLRNSTQMTSKQRPYSQVSHSGSNLSGGEYDYGPEGDAIRSTNSYLNEQYGGQENRPPSPLVPSQISDNPKYHAHRNSMNLQHPQPRQGPTGRFQHHLENEAQAYGGEQFSPTSQTSSVWGHQRPSQNQGNPNAQQRYSGYSGNDRLSPISDAGYSDSSSAMMELGQEEHERSLGSGPSGNSVGSATGHRREAIRRDDEPLVPQRPPKIPMSPAGGRQANYVDHVSAARAGSPALDKSPVAALRSPQSQGRKPSGPRPQATSGQYSPGNLNSIKRTRFRGSPNQIDSSDEYR